MESNDSAIAAFKEWWENQGLLRGGLLVYNIRRLAYMLLKTANSV
jgi:hypothetical protein